MSSAVTAAKGLRAATAVALLQFAAHTTLFLRATPRHGPDEVAVVAAMQAHRFDFAGSTRSYWDFYTGYGLEAAVICLVEAVLFWILAGAVGAHASVVRPVVGLFLAFNVAHLALMARYFFVTPMVPDAVIALVLAVVWAKLRR